MDEDEDIQLLLDIAKRRRERASGKAVEAPGAVVAEPPVPALQSASSGPPVPFYAKREGPDDFLLDRDEVDPGLRTSWEAIEKNEIGHPAQKMSRSYLNHRLGLAKEMGGSFQGKIPQPRPLSPTEQAITSPGGILGAPALKAQSLMIEGVDKVFGTPEGETTDYMDRAAQGGMTRELINRAGEGTGPLAVTAGVAGTALDVVMDPTNLFGARAGGKAIEEGLTAWKMGKPVQAVIPEGVGNITRITPDGQVTVRVGNKMIDTTVDNITGTVVEKAHEVPLGMRGATEAYQTALGRIGGALTPDNEELRRGLAWLAGGRKAFIAGEDFANEVQTLQGRLGNVPSLAKGEGNRIRNAFQAISKEPKEAYDAVYDNLFYGTEVPDEIRAKYGEALPALRRSLSDLQEIHRTLKSMDPAVIDEYPIWLKRIIQEPEETRARRGQGAGTGAIPGLAPSFQRKDAYSATVSNLSVREANAIIDTMPPELRPIQFTAPGMSKGLVTGSDPDPWVGEVFKNYGETDIKWPDTPEGKQGRELFKSKVEWNTDLQGRGITFEESDPIRPQEIILEPDDTVGAIGPDGQMQDVVMREGVKQKVYSDKSLTGMDPELALKEAITPITDLPTVLSRSWADVLRRKANEDFFATIPGMTDTSTGKPITRFVSHKDLYKKEVRTKLAEDGFVVMEDNGKLERRWGAINAAEEDGVTGVHVVRKDVAEYLRESEKVQSALASATHGFLDAWAVNATNAPKTGFMNWLYNKVMVDSINGNFPGSPHLKRGRDLVRVWEETGVMPDELRQAAEKGLPLISPEKGMASIDDKVDIIYSDVVSKRAEPNDAGRRIYEAVGASPLAERPMEAAAGGFVQGGIRGISEGHGPMGIVGEAVLGAVETTALRKPAQMLREKYVNSDLFTTVGAYLKHYDDAIKRGLTGDEAVSAAVKKTIDLTQAGQWSRVGGFSEVLGAAPSGIAGAQHTGIRALQKLMLNRFIKFTEVDARLKMNALKYGGKNAIGAAAGAATIYALKEGGRKAGESMGILTPEESEFMNNALPEAVFVPIWDFAKGEPGMVSFPGKSVGVPVADIPDSWREAASQVTGPGFVTTMELFQGDDAQNLLTGGPIRKIEKHEGTMEGTGEALIRTNQERWESPWGSTGRYAGIFREMGADAIEAPPGRTAPTVPMMAATALLGPVRDAEPAQLRKSNIDAFFARRREIEKDAGQARKKSVPSMRDESGKQRDERIAALAEEYLKKGIKMEELALPQSVAKALYDKGYGR